MPTTTFSLIQAPAVVYGGGFTDESVGGHNARLLGNSFRLDLTAVGTTLTLPSCYSYGFSWTVDGGAVQTQGSTGAWIAITLFSGLADGPHVVSILGIDNQTFIDRDTTYAVTGASPAITTPAGFSTNNYLIGSNIGPFQVDGSMTFNASQDTQPAYVSGAAADGSVRFLGTLTGLQVFVFCGYGVKVHVAVDGVDTGIVYTSASPSWNWIPLGTTYDGTAQHEYRISGHGTPGYACFFVAVMAVGGDINHATIPAEPTWAFYGDSITHGDVGTNNDNGLSYAYEVSLARNIGVRNLGIDGSTVVTTGQTSTANITGLSPQPSRVVILYGTNDESAGTTAATFQSAYQTMVQDLINGLPAATPIDCLMYLPKTGDNLTTRAQYETAIQAAIAACASAGSVRYIATDGWINPTTDTVDGLHPNPGGYTKITAAYLATLPAGGSTTRSASRGWIPRSKRATRLFRGF